MCLRYREDELAVDHAVHVGALATGAVGALANTYTPFTLLRYPRRFELLSIVIYLVLGWLGLFLMPSLFASLPPPAAVLIVTGGVLYSAGVAFHVWKALPFHNAIWHGFVVLAAGCHYAAIWQAVLLTSARP